MSKDRSRPVDPSHPVDPSRRRRIEDPAEYERGRRAGKDDQDPAPEPDPKAGSK